MFNVDDWVIEDGDVLCGT